ncbi:MAG: LysR family transcriptional regulator [Burkholderiales bacterium]|nr:LysR family transcriptional regulator [Burkholderiales bacterium]
MDRLQSMRVFQRVVDEGGFAAAARKMHLDPAVVTRLLVDLEKHLGAPLLQRTTRRAALTPAGEEYLARVRLILADIDEADANIRGQTKELRGRLRILASPVIATHMLAPAIADFHALHPEIQLDIRVLDMANPPIEEYDLTFLSGSAPLPADIVVREVTKSHAVLYASPAYIKRFGEPMVPSDLNNHRMLRLRLASGRMGPLTLMSTDPGTPDIVVETPVVLIADHTDTLMRATLDGGGISSQGEDIAAPFVKSGQLLRVVSPWITNRLTLLAAFPNRKFLPVRGRVFLEHLIKHVQENMTQGANQTHSRSSRSVS